MEAPHQHLEIAPDGLVLDGQRIHAVEEPISVEQLADDLYAVHLVILVERVEVAECIERTSADTYHPPKQTDLLDERGKR